MKYIDSNAALGDYRETDEIFTFIPEEIRVKDDISATQNFLATHVKSDQGWAYYAAGTPDLLDQMTLKKKIATEINIWLRRLAEPNQQVREQSSRAATGIPSHDSMSRKAAARSCNILKALRVLMLDPREDNQEVRKVCANWKTELAPLRLALQWEPQTEKEKAHALVRGMLLRSYVDPRWSMAWPLIIIRAAAWSQTGWDQPYLWEAHSALEAKQGNRGELLSPIETDVLAFLVRFQSAPGQFCRNTGDDRFYTKALELAEEFGKETGQFSEAASEFQSDLLVSLGILAHAQEFRSSTKPHTTEFADYWDKITSCPERAGRSCTWHYTGQLQKEIGERNLEDFLATAERAVELRGKDKRVVSFSLGRDSYESKFLHEKLRERVLDVISRQSDQERLQRFDEQFLCTNAPVPDVFDPNIYELCAIVRPKDHILATEMVFKDVKEIKVSPAMPEGENDTAEAAWYLFKYVFDVAMQNDYIQWQPGKPGNYCPTYLIGRLLDVVFQLRPESCLAIPLLIDGRSATPIRLPKVPLDGKSQDLPAVRAIARYVCAFICNKVMAQPVEQFHQGLKNLDRLPHGRFWSDLIRKEFSLNNFARLLGKYVDNFFSVVEHIQFDREILPTGPFLTRENSNITSELASLVEARGKVVVLAIDIGATSAKMALFEISTKRTGEVCVQPWESHPKPFRVLTALKKQSNSRDEKRRRYKDAGEFCGRILDEVAQRLKSDNLSLSDIHAVGMNWPGPVQHGFIRGWSKVLENFDCQIQKNRDQHVTDDLHDMVRLDIRSAMENAMNLRTGAMRRAIMVNDGVGHAAGELLRLALQLRPIIAGTNIILKAGTGTAGAVVVNGTLVEGLMEFGKLVVNLAYDPKDDYPQGLANLYCSARTLPMLMNLQQLHLGQLVPTLSSLEVGMLSNLDVSMLGEDGATGLSGEVPANRKRFHDELVSLVFECGIIALAQDLPDEIDTAVLGELLDRDNWGVSQRANARRVVQEALNLAPDKAWDKLRELVRTRGIIRIEAILQLDAGLPINKSEIGQLIDFINSSAAPVNTRLRDKIDEMSQVARGCIEAFGKFIGDLSALLCEEYKLDRIITGGGVLSGRTRDIALQSAIEWLENYSAIQTPTRNEGDIIFQSEHEKQFQRVGQGHHLDAIDSATLGVGVEAAFAFLKQLRQDGLSEIYAMVQEMKLTETLEVEQPEDKVMTSSAVGRQTAPVELKEFGLTANMVKDYLIENAHDLGIIPAAGTEKEGGSLQKFTKWPIG